MHQYSSSQTPGRLEDRRFVSGQGCYLDDLQVADAAIAVVLRSPHAHARIRNIDVCDALKMAGVLAIFTGADWAQSGLGSIPTRTPAKNSAGETPYCPPRPGLAIDTVRFVGDPVALVVARDDATAQSALEAIAIDYDPLPSVTDPVAALAPGAPLVWPQVAGNECLDFSAGDAEAVAAQFAIASHVARVRLVNQRVTAVAIEPRAALAEFDPINNKFTLTATTQNIHAHRQTLATDVLFVDPADLRVRAVDIGGGFGVKNGLYPEYALVLWAAREVRRPVKWVSNRSDSFSADTHGREQHNDVELALSAAGEFLALRVTTVGNVGAYMSTVGPFVASGGSARTQGGPYRLPALHFSSRVAFTNTAPTDPYRGAGRPEATYVMERIIDVAARELDIDPVELRRRNALVPEDLPYRTAMGAEIDSGDFPELLERAIHLSDRAGFAARAAAAQAAGKRRGLGYCLYFECTGGAPKEYARLSFADDGVLCLAVGTHSTGMGHETVFCKMVGARLGIDPASIRFVQADTDATPVGGGHGGSRSLEMGGAAVAEVIEQTVKTLCRLAADHLETAEADLELRDGQFAVVGTDRLVALQTVVMNAVKAGVVISEDSAVERGRISFPGGCHAAEVEIDTDTGATRVVNYVAVDDFGTIINRQLADGQVMGGAGQGIGQALQEQIIYAEGGQLVTGSLMDYALPRADELPDFSVDYIEHAPTKNNPLGVKGAGEAGCVGALAAVVNATVDALAANGVTHIDMPLTAERVWRSVNGSGERP